MTSHPPHMIETNNTFPPSSFIPFCSYKTHLGISEPFPYLPNTSFPMCNSSTPVALDAQLCYSIKLDMKSQSGRQGGLTLVLDMNEDRSVDFESLVLASVQEDGSKIAAKSELEPADNWKGKGKVYVHLLSPFEGSAEGSYSLKSVKKIKGTTDFLDMPKTDRECVRETIEACVKRNLLEECHCAPWELANDQVDCFRH